MTFIVGESCIKCKLADCVEVCPEDCLHEGPNMLVLNPAEWIDKNRRILEKYQSLVRSAITLDALLESEQSISE